VRAPLIFKWVQSFIASNTKFPHTQPNSFVLHPSILHQPNPNDTLFLNSVNYYVSTTHDVSSTTHSPNLQLACTRFVHLFSTSSDPAQRSPQADTLQELRKSSTISAKSHNKHQPRSSPPWQNFAELQSLESTSRLTSTAVMLSTSRSRY
jgi:hypothetical protein